MKSRKLLKISAWVLGGVVALPVIALAVVYLNTSARVGRSYRVTARGIAVPEDAEAIARGHHIAEIRGCLECHGSDLAGKAVVDDALVGHLFAPNITRGRGGLPADYDLADYELAIRHGVSRERRPLLVMPSEEFAGLSDEDLGALIAYLKSVPAVDKPRGPMTLGPLGRVLIFAGQVRIAAEKIDHARADVATVAIAPTAEYGRYLATSCVGCHGENFSGGKIPGVLPDWPPASNLTTHHAGAMVGWSEADFIKTIRTHRRPGGDELNAAMPAVYGQMTDVELQAVWRYLRTLPAVETGKRSG